MAKWNRQTSWSTIIESQLQLHMQLSFNCYFFYFFLLILIIIMYFFLKVSYNCTCDWVLFIIFLFNFKYYLLFFWKAVASALAAKFFPEPGQLQLHLQLSFPVRHGSCNCTCNWVFSRDRPFATVFIINLNYYVFVFLKPVATALATELFPETDQLQLHSQLSFSLRQASCNCTCNWVLLFF